MGVEKTPTELVREMAGGFSLSQMLYTTVKLGVPDELASGPRHARDLAPALNANPQTLHRFLRMLVVIKLLSQDEDGRFMLSPLGHTLRTDHPDALFQRILYIGEINYRAAQGMLHTVQTGEVAFDHVFGVPFFDYLAEHPYLGGFFNGLMSQQVEDRAAGIVAAYDFSGVGTVVDVGGGKGTLVSAILGGDPGRRAVIFDRPEVLAEARLCLEQSGLDHRCRLVPGDFFRDPVPPEGDLYLLSNIIHDWDDEKSVRILSNCRSAMSSGSTLLLIEQIMPERAEQAPVTVASDFSMMLLLTGRERTRAEFEGLLAGAGLRLASVLPFEPSRSYSGRKSNWAVIEVKTATTT